MIELKCLEIWFFRFHNCLGFPFDTLTFLRHNIRVCEYTIEDIQILISQGVHEAEGSNEFPHDIQHRCLQLSQFS